MENQQFKKLKTQDDRIQIIPQYKGENVKDVYFLEQEEQLNILQQNIKDMNEQEMEKNFELNENQQKILKKPRICYTCKAKYNKVHFFYDQLCESCSELNYQKRHLKCNLIGKIALVTGGRVKIGYEIVLILLRNNCDLVIVTTRFPKDALLRFSKESDFEQFKNKIMIYGIDFRDLKQVNKFCEFLNQKLPKLDILINNAAQTLRRDPMYYQHMLEFENLDQQEISKKLNVDKKDVEQIVDKDFEYNKICKQYAVKMLEKQLIQKQKQGFSIQENQQNILDQINQQEYTGIQNDKGLKQVDDLQLDEMIIIPNISQGSLNKNQQQQVQNNVDNKNQQEIKYFKNQIQNLEYSVITSQIPVAKPDFKPVEEKKQFLPPSCLDANQQQVDLSQKNSWVQKFDETDIVEFAEIQFINAWAPYILIQNLKPLLCKNNDGLKEYRFIANVSSMEGKFNRNNKSSSHPHTNMSKASLNMLSRTSGQYFSKFGIYINSADTGWVSEMNPNSQNIQRTVPLDEVDGAMRVLDHIFIAFNTNKVEYSQFYKDYTKTSW